MSQQVNITEFSGTQEDLIQPTDFLKNINRSFMSSSVTPTDEQKINAIGLWLKSESPAEEWFNEINTPKDKYANLEQSFKQQFPDVERMKKSKLELERELAEMRIKPEDLGVRGHNFRPPTPEYSRAPSPNPSPEYSCTPTPSTLR